MNITKSGKLIAVIITLIAISASIMISVHNRNKEYMKFLSLGVASGSDYLNLVYIKLQNEENLNDTIDVIVPIIELFSQICFYKRIDFLSDSYETQKLEKQFLKDLAYCIRNDKPMIVSPDVIDEFNYERPTVVIDKAIEREFILNGCEHYIDEDGYMKGYKWVPFDTIPNPPLNDSARINRFNNLVYLLQKERIGVYFNYDKATNYWGYSVWR